MSAWLVIQGQLALALGSRPAVGEVGQAEFKPHHQTGISVQKVGQSYIHGLLPRRIRLSSFYHTFVETFFPYAEFTEVNREDQGLW